MNKGDVRIGQKVKWRRTFAVFGNRKRGGVWSQKKPKIEHIGAEVLSTRAGGRRVRIQTDEPRIRTVSNTSLSTVGSQA